MTMISPERAGGSNICAFMDMIARSELGSALLAESDNGYNVLVGSTPGSPVLFYSYEDHPRKLVQLRPGLSSTAAGRYQVLSRYYDIYKKQLGLPDFSPLSQDLIAIQYLKECKVVDLIKAGEFAQAVEKCSHIWASLPGNTYGQHQNTLVYLQHAYTTAGGTVAC